jgi:pimeloyl-ACP methyl ester carboxylesterase
VDAALQRWKDRAASGLTILASKSSTWPRARAHHLLLVHGYPFSSFDWVRIWPALSERFSLIAHDVLGLGFSAKPALGVLRSRPRRHERGAAGAPGRESVPCTRARHRRQRRAGDYNDGRRVTHKVGRFVLDRYRYRNRWLRAMRETAVPMRRPTGPCDPNSGRHMADR